MADGGLLSALLVLFVAVSAGGGFFISFFLGGTGAGGEVPPVRCLVGPGAETGAGAAGLVFLASVVEGGCGFACESEEDLFFFFTFPFALEGLFPILHCTTN